MVNRLDVRTEAKHVRASFLHVQSFACGQLLEIKPVQGLENMADLGTKHVSTRVLETSLGCACYSAKRSSGNN